MPPRGYLPHQKVSVTQRDMDRREPVVPYVQNPKMLKPGHFGRTRRPEALFMGLGDRRCLQISGSAADLSVASSVVNVTAGLLKAHKTRHQDGGADEISVAALSGLLADGQLSLVSSNDTTGGYLNGKLLAGANVTLTEGSDGADETLTIATTLSGAIENSDMAEGTFANMAPGGYNCLRNADFEYDQDSGGVADWWGHYTQAGTTVGLITTDQVTGSQCYKLDNVSGGAGVYCGIYTNYFIPIDVNEVYQFCAQFKGEDATNPTIAARLVCYDEDQSLLGTENIIYDTTPPTAWTRKGDRVTGEVAASWQYNRFYTGTKFVKVYIYNGATGGNGYLLVDRPWFGPVRSWCRRIPANTSPDTGPFVVTDPCIRTNDNVVISPFRPSTTQHTRVSSINNLVSFSIYYDWTTGSTYQPHTAIIHRECVED